MKEARQAMIIQLIGERPIETQEELSRCLREAGFPATQATVSRDIRDLHMVKQLRDGCLCYAAGEARDSEVKDSESDASADTYTRVFREAFVSVEASGNLLVLHTKSGMAMAVAAALDGMKWPEILGCIGGDDTIFCALRLDKDAHRLMLKMQELAAGPRPEK